MLEENELRVSQNLIRVKTCRWLAASAVPTDVACRGGWVMWCRLPMGTYARSMTEGAMEQLWLP